MIDDTLFVKKEIQLDWQHIEWLDLKKQPSYYICVCVCIWHSDQTLAISQDNNRISTFKRKGYVAGENGGLLKRFSPPISCLSFLEKL